MRIKQNILVCAIAALSVAGCNDAKRTEPDPGRVDAAKSDAPEGTGQSADTPADPASLDGVSDPLRGTVKETMDSGGYTYVLLDTAQGEVWAAARRFAVVVGAEVEIAGLATMRNFRSPSLGREFEEIQFVDTARVIGDDPLTSTSQSQNPAPVLPAGHPPLGGDATAHSDVRQSGGSAAAEIEPLQGGVTVAELFERKSDLSGTTVRFRGRVVKANQGILGLNWMHIRDGTGDPGGNDITVTSKEGFAAVGSIVTVEGTLALNRDFGAGYVYGVIVEDAEVTSEGQSPAP